MKSINSIVVGLCTLFAVALVQAKEPFSALDVFKINYVSNPVVSPDGEMIVFNHNTMDITRDKRRSDLWLVDSDGDNMRPLTNGLRTASGAVFSPTGDRVAYVMSDGKFSQIFLQWLDSGDSIQLTRQTTKPSNLSFSPDGTWLAFNMAVADEPETMGTIPKAPGGASWSRAIIVETRSEYVADGRGRLPFYSQQVFVVPTKGGAAQQLTAGPQSYNSRLSWTPDSSALLLSINDKDDVNKPLDSEIFSLDIATSNLTVLTSRDGPDSAPVLSPNGKRMAWVGFDDKRMSFQSGQLYSANIDGTDIAVLTDGINFSVDDFAWHKDSRGFYIQYDQRGRRILASLSAAGRINVLTDTIGGQSLGRPYTSGEFAANEGVIAITVGTENQPAELATVDRQGNVVTLTDFNRTLREFIQWSPVEERSVLSSIDQREIQYWLVLPPGFDKQKSYPLMLEIHGGPHAAYGPQFAAELQLFAAAGYVVVYANPRGSTSYGAEFAQTISHNYPSQDYDDLMDVVDATIESGFIDKNQLYVTGGSGGGVLTAWIVGKTDRFRAAVVAKPVINWISHTLSADNAMYFANYWLAELPWNDPMGAWSRSPLALVGNVTTPTMLLTGSNDWRTPMWESEQYYNALLIEGVDTALVRVPGASHGIAARPSRLIAKVNAILAWFERYSKEPSDPAKG
jgi:dipeptidyl aminopeptidase/acylaminoacyl peptidase